MFKKRRLLNLVLLFLAVAALLVISFVFIFEIGTRAARVAEDLLQRQSTVQRLAAVVTTASDAETGQRGYLLTGEEKYLAPYTNALSAMPVRMAALRKTAAEGLVSACDVDKVDELVSAKFSELAKTVDLKRQHRDAEALAIVKAGQGQQLMDEVRNACDQIVITQQAQINADLVDTIRDGKIRSLLYFGGLVVNLGVLGWVCWRIFAEMGVRDAVAKTIEEHREYLDVTLASIGDGVIVTDEGTISAASAGHGTGSTFLITLPKAFRPDPVAPNAASSDILPLGLGSLRVLLIEDHEDTAIVMAHMLEDMGHNVVSANSVASAVDVLTRETFDLIVSDIGLPDGNGVSLIHAVRSFCDAPAIALTGYGMREDIERCLNAGFNRHVTKPVTFETLQKIIAEVCAEKPVNKLRSK